jgi:hypothetical protein
MVCTFGSRKLSIIWDQLKKKNKKEKEDQCASRTDPNIVRFKLIDDLSRTNKFKSKVRSMDLKQSPRSIPRGQMDQE